MPPPRILIAGAGIGGLTAAPALMQRGFECEIYEQAPQLREVGAGIWISPNGATALFQLGLEAEMRRVNLAATERELCVWNSGAAHTLYSSSTPVPWDSTLFMMLRAEPQRMLAEAIWRIDPGAIRFAAPVIDFEQDAAGVTLRFNDGRTARGDVLIGADGLHSRVRHTAFGASPGVFTGVSAWRGLVPKEQLPTRFTRPAFSTWIGPTAHVTVYHVRRGDDEVVSFSGQADSHWQNESWSEPGSITECLHDFNGWHRDIRTLIERAESLFKWGIFLRAPLNDWSSGRVTLLGDACHAMVPYLGQGANMAIEDAIILARCLDQNRDTVEAALLRYQRARRPRTTLAIERSRAMQHVFHHAALAEPATAGAYIEQEWHPARVAERNTWLFEYDANSVAI